MMVVTASSCRNNIVVQFVKIRAEQGQNGFVTMKVSLVTGFPPEKV